MSTRLTVASAAAMATVFEQTRLKWLKKLDLMMDLVVKWDLGGGACGKDESGHDQDTKSAIWYDDRAKKELRENIRC